jgi:hypothetical protein
MDSIAMGVLTDINKNNTITHIMSAEAPVLIQRAGTSLLSRDLATQQQQEAERLCAESFEICEGLLNRNGTDKKDRFTRGAIILGAGLSVIGLPIVAGLDVLSRRRFGKPLFDLTDYKAWHTTADTDDPAIKVNVTLFNPNRSNIDVRIQGVGEVLRLGRSGSRIYPLRGDGGPFTNEYDNNWSPLAIPVDLRRAQEWNQVISTLRDQPVHP